MDIHISRKGEQFGPYTEAVARQYLQDGTLAATDMAWYAGADDWKPLGEVLGMGSAGGQWHYSHEGAQYGPADESEIIKLIQSGAIAPSTPVCSVGGNDWRPAREHECFQVEVFPKGPGSGSTAPGPPPEPQPPAEPVATPPPEPAPAPTPPESGGGDDEIHISRKGKKSGPTSRAKALELFASGKLRPTDWGWHDGMDEWKPIWEVLGQESLPGAGGTAAAPATAGAGGGGKRKKVLLIVGIVVGVLGLAAAGYFLIYPMFKGDGEVEDEGESEEPEAKVDKPAVKDSWIQYSAADRSFSVMMPAEPKPVTTAVPTPLGRINISMAELSTEDVNYVVGVTIYPNGLVQSMGDRLA